MEQTGTEQLQYYLSSLDELGEILIDAEKAQSVGAGILRLTLGTVMASKGAIFLYNKKTDELSFYQVALERPPHQLNRQSL